VTWSLDASSDLIATLMQSNDWSLKVVLALFSAKKTLFALIRVEGVVGSATVIS
jgi:hypothetical protein